MATNQVNIVNLLNLPQAQVILPGNYLIVNNDLGTQIVDWADVAVLKLDDNGGATITSLTASDIVAGVITSSLLSASNYYSNGETGTLAASGYYNLFTVTNGIVTNADFVIGSPEYTDIINTQLPALTSQLTDIYKKLYIDYTSIVSSTSSFNAYFATAAPDGIVTNVNNIQSVDVTWSCTPSVSAVPTFTFDFPDSSGRLHINGIINYSPNTPITWSMKILKDYQ
jgi:hypothetical protein